MFECVFSGLVYFGVRVGGGGDAVAIVADDLRDVSTSHVQSRKDRGGKRKQFWREQSPSF